MFGDRKSVLIPPVQELTAAGFAVASIDYRRAPMVVMASQVEDAQCAVRFLRANAAALGIDPDRIGAFGHSEGGWLSAMLGLAGPRAGAEASQYQGYSSQVQAVVDEAGPTDLPRLLQEGPMWMGQAAFVLYRGQPVSTPPDNSAVDYVRPGAPPFLIVQGTDDAVIPFQQSAELAERLQAAGDAVRLVPVQHGPHDLEAGDESPDPDQLGHLVTEFLVATLHPAAP
jgi:acetyl esterase/lipase